MTRYRVQGKLNVPGKKDSTMDAKGNIVVTGPGEPVPGTNKVRAQRLVLWGVAVAAVIISLRVCPCMLFSSSLHLASKDTVLPRRLQLRLYFTTYNINGVYTFTAQAGNVVGWSGSSLSVSYRVPDGPIQVRLPLLRCWPSQLAHSA